MGSHVPNGLIGDAVLELRNGQDDYELHSRWILAKLGTIPAHFEELLPCQSENHGLGTISTAIMGYQQICTSIKEYPYRNANFGITDLVESLLKKKVLCIPDVHTLDSTVDGNTRMSSAAQRSLDQARVLIFAIIGWQTMLYIPMLHCRPHSQFYIDDVFEGFQSQTYINLVQDQSNAEYNLPDFLLGFGCFIPTDHTYSSHVAIDENVAQVSDGFGSEGLNAWLLCSIGKIKIQWVDVLPPHLEFNEATRTLFLFKYPSFCRGVITKEGSQGARQLIHSCVKRQIAMDQIDKLMIETLLSFKFLFGGDKKSRRLFKSRGPGKDFRDPLLVELCTSYCSSESLLYVDCESYRLKRDFLLYRRRLIILKSHLDRNKPQTLPGLWRDNRDSAQWWTFWTLLLFGVIGTTLVLVQIGLQIAQLRGGTATP